MLPKVAVVCLLTCVLVNVYGREYHRSRTTRNAEAVSPLERTAQFWIDDAQASIAQRLRTQQNLNTARNVIMFLGDGMSLPTQAAARTLLGQREGRPGEESQLVFETFPTVGLAKTYCVDAQIADSACTATAYLCGVKNNDGTIGVTADVPRYDCEASTNEATHLNSIAQWALEDGRDAGIVTNTRITHASPSGAYARIADRDWESDTDVLAEGHDPTRCPDIAQQLITTYPGNRFKVILGGGRREFLPNTTIDDEGTYGRRSDGRNLIDEWLTQKTNEGVEHAYIWNREQVENLMDSPPEYLLGLFESGHIPYHMIANQTTEPTLAQLTEIAIKSLSRNEKGYFLFIESGRIDHAHHDNYIDLSLDETIHLHNAVNKAIELVDDDDTLIIVTADHSHVMAFNGYTHRGGDILGPSDDVDEDGVPYMTLSYSNGPGFRQHTNGIRPNVLNDDNYRVPEDWRAHVEIPLEWETHGGEEIAVFATGPQHQMFKGMYEQSHIPHLMAYAGCFGEGEHACSSAAVINPLVCILTTMFVLVKIL